jgi:hypothetical protein
VKQSNLGNRKNRDGRILTALPEACKLCSTYAFWGGAREITRRGFIEIHPYSKGGCREDGFKHLEMAALATYKGWELWPDLGSERCGPQRQQTARPANQEG